MGICVCECEHGHHCVSGTCSIDCPRSQWDASDWSQVERGERGDRQREIRGVWTWHPQLACDITPAGTGSRGVGRLGYSRWHQGSVWVSWPSSWVNLRQRPPPSPPNPTHPPTNPSISTFVLSPSHFLRPSLVCDCVYVPRRYLPSLTHRLLMPCVSSCSLPLSHSLFYVYVCVYLCLCVCLLLIRSLWPCISIECDQTVANPPRVICPFLSKTELGQVALSKRPQIFFVIIDVFRDTLYEVCISSATLKFQSAHNMGLWDLRLLILDLEGIERGISNLGIITNINQMLYFVINNNKSILLHENE